jgi:hypothetical protein
MMRAVSAVLLLLALSAAPASAEPRRLSDSELGGVAGGYLDLYLVMPVIVVNSHNNAAAVGVASQNITANNISNIDVQSVINLDTLDQAVNLPPVVVNGATGQLPALPLQALGALSARSAAQPPVWVPWARELRSNFGPGL